MHMTFALAIAIASSFWSDRHVPTPCHPQAVQVSYATMRGWGDGGAITAAFPSPVACDIYLTPAANIERSDIPDEFCADITHEVGNIDGVPETPDAGYVMSLYYTDTSRPWDCIHWQRWVHTHWLATEARQGHAGSSRPGSAARP